MNSGGMTGGRKKAVVGLLALAGLVALVALVAVGFRSGVLTYDPVPAPSPVVEAPPPSFDPARTRTAVFAGGCFWCVESDFDAVPGVLATTSGYTGGNVANPSYAEVSSHTTGHAEAVQVVYDPERVTYAQLVEHFWRTIDPTTVDRQFCDVGSPYRTAIFVDGPEQEAVARASLDRLQRDKPFAAPIVTRIEPADTFYKAEAYHQDYYLKNPLRYRYYRTSCGRDARLKDLWGEQAATH